MLYATKLWIEFRLRMLSGKHTNDFQCTNYKANYIIFVVLVLSAVILIGESLLDSTNLHVTRKLAAICLAYVCSMQLTLSVLHTVGAVNNIYTSLMAVRSVDHYMNVNCFSLILSRV